MLMYLLMLLRLMMLLLLLLVMVMLRLLLLLLLRLLWLLLVMLEMMRLLLMMLHGLRCHLLQKSIAVQWIAMVGCRGCCSMLSSKHDRSSVVHGRGCPRQGS
jgi:hypothetical protein